MEDKKLEDYSIQELKDLQIVAVLRQEYQRASEIREVRIKKERDLEASKYYTPTIEEFHIGFECEFKNEIYEPPSFRKEICDWSTLDMVYNIDEHYQEDFKDTFRVKYLDKEDIENLGWNLTPQYAGSENRKYWWELGKLIPDAEEMWHPLGNWKYRLSIGENNRLSIDGRNSMNGGQRIMFNGTIKNKSELKKLMKQLGIYE